MKFIIATNNSKKLKELQRILEPLGIEAVSAKEAGIKLDDVEETGTTFAENAFLKVDALNGQPGVYSARYAGENATDEDRINKMLLEMKDIPADKRNAHFTSSICCILPNGEKLAVEGICNGTIGFEPKGDGNFGYDPIFVYNNDKTFAEMSSEEKDKVSHRGKALILLQKELKKYLEEN